MISALQDERKQVQNLEKENNEIRSAINQHKEVLEIIMFKYREQSKQLSRINRLESIYRIPKNNLDSQRHKYLQEKMNELPLVINEACNLDEGKIEKQEQLILKLKQENNKIKRLLLTK